MSVRLEIFKNKNKVSYQSKKIIPSRGTSFGCTHAISEVDIVLSPT